MTPFRHADPQTLSEKTYGISLCSHCYEDIPIDVCKHTSLQDPQIGYFVIKTPPLVYEATIPSTASNKMASIVAPFIAILATLQLTASLPLEGARVNGEEIIPDVGTLAEQRHQFPWQVSGKYQGDIMLQVSDNARNGLIDSNARQVATIQSAFNEFHTRTCIRFRPYVATDRDYIYIAGDPTGCWSYGQVVNLQLNGCVHHGVAVHELLHALGFFHQQSATERDDYVRILWNNIEPGMEHNFDKYAANQITNYNTIYDYLSIMHYDGYAFSFNGQPTIQSLRGNVQLGQIDTMTETDIIKLERMYGCRA
uniref:Metalloendopeptidase n=1 Tax=Timema shepardi TaxID=629360 RepID=A0A7R9AUC0_TIMSH|nr:unnamed protein product [Timema shepardi]